MQPLHVGFTHHLGFHPIRMRSGRTEDCAGRDHGSTACEPRSYSPAAWLPTAPPERTALSGCSPGNQVRTACRRDEPSGRLMPLAYATGHAARAVSGQRIFCRRCTASMCASDQLEWLYKVVGLAACGEERGRRLQGIWTLGGDGMKNILIPLAVLVAIWVAWRLRSRRALLPCPAELAQLAQLRAKIPSRFVAALLPHQELGRPEPLALACSADCEGLTVCAETDSSPQVFAMHGSASISALRPTF